MTPATTFEAIDWNGGRPGPGTRCRHCLRRHTGACAMTPADAANGETWHVHAWEGDERTGRWSVWTAGEERVAVCLTRELADQIAAAHNATNQATATCQHPPDQQFSFSTANLSQGRVETGHIAKWCRVCGALDMGGSGGPLNPAMVARAEDGEIIRMDHPVLAERDYLNNLKRRATEAEAALAAANEQLAAYKKAWELPDQPITQGVVPSAGEVAANAVEEARVYRDQRDAARAERNTIQHQEIAAAQVEFNAMRHRATEAEAALGAALATADGWKVERDLYYERYVTVTRAYNDTEAQLRVAREALVALAKVQYDGTVEGLQHQIETEDWGDALDPAATRAAYELTLAAITNTPVSEGGEG